MKRCTLTVCATALLLVLFGASVAGAITWFRVDSAAVAWDPVTTMVLTDSTTAPLPAGETVSYRLWLKDQAGTVEQYGADQTATTATLTFTEEGRWVVGIQAVRFPGTVDEEVSDITWSDSTDATMVPNPFGIRIHYPPGQVRNPRTVQ